MSVTNLIKYIAIIRLSNFENKNIFIFIRIIIILICVVAAIRIDAILWEFLPHTNFYGDANMNKMPGLLTALFDSVIGVKETTISYNEGDIFQRIFGIAIWAYLVLITTFIINLFKKDFMKNFLEPVGISGNIKKDGYYPWILFTVVFPLAGGLVGFLLDTNFYFIGKY